MPVASYPPDSHSSAPPAGRFRVVVVVEAGDRSSGSPGDVVLLLRATGYAVEEVLSTEQALATARGGPPFLMVVDHDVDGTASFDLLERLRAARDDFEAILITGSPELGTLLRSVELRLFRCIHMPMVAGELVVAVAGAARRLALRQQLVDRKRELEVQNLQLQAELRIEESRRLLSERLASIGQFAASLAHEVNNPLAYIHSNVELLRSGAAQVVRTFQGLATGRRWCDATEEDRGAVTHYMLELEAALEDCATGLDLIRGISADLSTVARYRSEAAEVFDANEVVRTSTRIAMTGQQENVRICLELVPGRAWMRGGPGTIAQVVMNFLANAINATDHASGRPNVVTVRTGVRDAEVWIEVSDTGLGISEDRLSTVFDLFVTYSEGGTGIGLGLARQIVSEHKGTIDVESQLGRGTTFRARFPASPDEAPRSAGGRGRALPLDFRVLFVDDDVRLRRLYARLFPEQEVLVVASADEAMEVVAEGRVDCIVCDLHMPAADGLNLFNRIRKKDPDLSSRFVFVSGTDAMLARVREEAPNVPLVRKPFTVEELRRAIGNACSALRATPPRRSDAGD